MNTYQKLIVFGVSALFAAVVMLVAYNVWDRLQAAQLYRECLELRQKKLERDPKSTEWCHFR